MSGLGPGMTGVPSSSPSETLVQPGPPSSEGGQTSTDEAREEQPKRGPIDFFRRLLRPQSASPEPDPSSEEGPSGGTADGSPPSGLAPGGRSEGQPGRQRQERPGATTAAGGAPERLTLTRAELAEFVNGEVNRREAKRQAEADRERRRQLRDADPITFAEEDREREAVEEAQAAQRERMGQTLAYYDQHTMVPFLNSLPTEIVEQLRQETGGGVEGLEGRERLVARGRELLEARIRTDERAKTQRALRANPALLKQQLLREAESDSSPDPEVGGGFAPQADGLDMNTQLRSLLASRRTRR